MLYLPTNRYLIRFNRLSYPLPPGLLPWLYSRGLGIYVLPKDRNKAIKIMQRVLGSHVCGDTKCQMDDRLLVDTAHFNAVQNVIFIPHATFYRTWGENVLIHEVAHAVDFNYTATTGEVISAHQTVWDSLKPDRPLNKYCEDNLEKTGFQLEQFACSFSAFFQEPDKDLRAKVATIDDLSPELIQFFKKNIMDHFR